MKTLLRHRTAVRPNALRDAFTLIEMMVVVALIGILIGGVFRLLSAAGESAKRAETIERLQRVENAISGFYATYGTYPPVPRHGSPDPFAKEDANGNTTPVTALAAENANRAAGCQPVPFEFPSAKAYDAFIAANFPPGVYSANINPSAFSADEPEWPKVKLFKYGLLSFLLPRYDAIGEFRPGAEDTNLQPASDFFRYNQWKNFNKSERLNQIQTEADACARWLPNLKGLVWGGKTLMGVGTGQMDAGYPRFTSVYSQGTGNSYVLGKMSIHDGWGRDLFYYSAPPYQSYRLWSAGPDGNTFSADFPLTALKSTDHRKTVGGWIKDDIVRSSR